MVDGRFQVRRRAEVRLWLSAAWLILLVIVALFAPYLAPKDPLEQDLFAGRLPPFLDAGGRCGILAGHR